MLGSVQGTRNIVINKTDQFPALIELIVQAFIISPSPSLSSCVSHSYFFLIISIIHSILRSARVIEMYKHQKRETPYIFIYQRYH